VKPLEGKLVVLLRAAGQGGALAEGLRSLGAEILEAPVIAIAPPEDPAPLRAALERLAEFDWIAFTSPNAVSALLDASRDASQNRTLPKLASIGPGTTSRLKEAGLEATLEATESHQEGLARALIARGVQGKKVLLPQSAIARDALASLLEAGGAKVTAVSAYRTRESSEDLAPLVKALEAGRVDAICFTSASTASNLARRLGEAVLRERLAGGRPLAVSMGPIASDALRALGVAEILEAREHTAQGMVARVREALSRETK
jgi:uroporphyrinogen III methyltransferase/synthase